MLDPQDYLKFLFALFAILNPPGAIPVLMSITAEQGQADRVATARTATVSVFIILLTALFFGEALLHFFGISIHSFRVGGGILILMMALSMMHARSTDTKQTQEESLEAANRQSVAVVPLAMPILAGPGAISAVILFGHRSSSWEHLVTVTVLMGILSLILYPFLRFSAPISRRLGQTGINIMTRVMGLILAAIAVEFIANGLKGLFPSLL
ncbi:MAG: YchE family NAAT transporter [Hahellaceae bacterium]|nr:YchE family NAAT transporter [Hahellaceae bacterium]